MAKYVYERWDFMYDLSVFPLIELSSDYLDSSVFLFNKNGEVSEIRTTIRNMRVGETCIFSNHASAWNQGSDRNINKKIDTDLYEVYRIYKSSFIASVRPTVLIEETIAEEGTYPDNGIQGDYWYIKTRKAFPDLHIKVNGELRKVQSAWVKVGGVLKEVKDIYVKKDGQLKKGI